MEASNTVNTREKVGGFYFSFSIISSGCFAWSIQYCWGTGRCFRNSSNRLHLATWLELLSCNFFSNFEANIGSWYTPKREKKEL
jgi:hypothetical protein